MSKIFDALNQGEGDISELVLASLGQEPKNSVPQPPAPEQTLASEPKPEAVSERIEIPLLRELPLLPAPGQTKLTESSESRSEANPASENIQKNSEKAAEKLQTPPEEIPVLDEIPIPEEIAGAGFGSGRSRPVPKNHDVPLTVSIPAAVAPARELRTLPLRLQADSPILPFDDNYRQASEQYRIVRTKIIQHPNQPQTIMVTSPASGDGKSVTAVNLAGALSLKSDARVLLLDADFRRPSVAKQLGLPPSPGLAEVLAGSVRLEDAAIQVEQFADFCVLPAGEPPYNPVELFDSAAWKAMCEVLRNRFRYIVMDSPPIEAVADYHLIQEVCDGAIVVVRPDHTTRTACLNALSLISKEKFLGVILNCVRSGFLGHQHGYYGYSYGQASD